MKLVATRRHFLALLTTALSWLVVPAFGQQFEPKERKKGREGGKRGGDPDEYSLPAELAEFAWLSLVLGRVTDRAVTVSALAQETLEGVFEIGTETAKYERKTDVLTLAAGQPTEILFDNLRSGTEYFYRLQFRRPGEASFRVWPESRFHTQRPAGSTFAFAIQGDSHPERPQMSDPVLYSRTLLSAASGNPDFYICMGDDFSVEKLRDVNAESLAQLYLLQRPFLGLVARSAPLFLLNGNHEQSSLFNFNQSDIRREVAVGTQNARNRIFPTPSPDGFYSGDSATLEEIGLLKDYCSWTWGDALFVLLDNYWHSRALVDSGFQEKDPGGDKRERRDRDWWGTTLGDAQYQWFKKTLETSKAKFKFVFAHHVQGTGRGGIEESALYEWGGRNRRGDWEFDQKRPGWELPVHQLMAKHGVTIFFQGHDHLYVQQERDGIVYQEVPMPADQYYMAHNESRYQSGVKLPNSGYLRVTVSPEQVKVDYVRCYLPKDENEQRKTGEVAHSYAIQSKAGHA